MPVNGIGQKVKVAGQRSNTLVKGQNSNLGAFDEEKRLLLVHLLPPYASSVPHAYTSSCSTVR
eukprot:1335128-Rhodomonas_salina.1